MMQQVGRPPVIVIGMHRSGTGIVTQLLNDMGMQIGWLKEGNAEAWLFLLINRWLFRKSGARWDHPLSVRRLMGHSPLRRAYACSIRGLISSPLRLTFLGWGGFLGGKRLLHMAEPWGWKDPRNTFTLPIWLDLFPDAKVLHVCRHGVDVADSLRQRQLRAIESATRLQVRHSFLYFVRSLHGEFAAPMRCEVLTDGLKVWEEYTEEARRQTSNLDSRQSLEIRYEDLLCNPEPTMRCVAEFCDLPVSAETISGLTARLDHSRSFAFRRDPTLAEFARTEAGRLERMGYEQ